MAKSSKGSGNTSSSTTKTSTNGTTIKLEPSNDKDYLCAHICFVKRNPIKGKVGQTLNQRVCTYAIWKQEEANQLIWKYKAEVGYRMRDRIPTPIMSEKQPQRASRFPLGVAAREGMFKLSELETSAAGRLRIPDVVVLKVSDQELINMRVRGNADWSKLIPTQKNIAKVIEIKFGKDRLSREQSRDYQKIAGGESRFKLLEDIDCSCELRNEHSNLSGGVSVGAKYTYIQNTFVAIKLKQQGLINIPTNNSSPKPIGDFLDQAPLYEIAVGAGIAIVVVGAIVLLPVSAAAVGASALGGYILATS
ncbi:VRR-NUC domain-containing protein [Acinetobacter tandoii]